MASKVLKQQVLSKIWSLNKYKIKAFNDLNAQVCSSVYLFKTSMKNSLNANHYIDHLTFELEELHIKML